MLIIENIVKEETKHHPREQVFAGISLLVLGPISVRISCELLIVIFSINDTLTDVKNLLQSEQEQDEQTRL